MIQLNSCNPSNHEAAGVILVEPVHINAIYTADEQTVVVLANGNLRFNVMETPQQVLDLSNAWGQRFDITEGDGEDITHASFTVGGEIAFGSNRSELA